jgi:hypothetical protein
MTRKKLAETLKTGIPSDKFDILMEDPDQQKGIDMLAAGLGILLAFEPMLNRFTPEQVIVGLLKLSTEGLIMAGMSEEKVAEMAKAMTSRASQMRRDYLEKVDNDPEFASQQTVASQLVGDPEPKNETGFDEFLRDDAVVDHLKSKSDKTPQFIIIDKNSSKVH